MINIRKATIEDAKEGTLMMDIFYKKAFSEMKLPYQTNFAETFAKDLIQNHLVLVAEINNQIIGTIGGIIQSYIFEPNQYMFQESFWYVKDEYRKTTVGMKLFNEMEKECIKRNINYILVASLGNRRDESLAKLYNKKKYNHFETSYIKKIGE